jgi:hypothetical protein
MGVRSDANCERVVIEAILMDNKWLAVKKYIYAVSACYYTSARHIPRKLDCRKY